MSVQTLYTAATGMEAMETKLDVIANNLANVNTTAFKKARANFEDLFYDQEVMPGTTDEAGNMTATGIAVGLGTAVSSTQTDFRQGAFLDTGNSLDVAIVGNGFFQVQDVDGSTVYTRDGYILGTVGDCDIWEQQSTDRRRANHQTHRHYRPTRHQTRVPRHP